MDALFNPIHKEGLCGLDPYVFIQHMRRNYMWNGSLYFEITHKGGLCGMDALLSEVGTGL